MKLGSFKMKAIIFIGLFWTFSSMAQVNCADYSGSYHLESDSTAVQIVLKIEQKNCESIRLDYFIEGGLKQSELYLLNGQKTKIGEYPDIGLTVYAAPYFKGHDVVIDTENRWSDGKSEFFKRRLRLVFSSKVHLLDQQGKFRNDGEFVPSVQTVYTRD